MRGFSTLLVALMIVVAPSAWSQGAVGTGNSQSSTETADAQLGAYGEWLGRLGGAVAPTTSAMHSLLGLWARQLR